MRTLSPVMAAQANAPAAMESHSASRPRSACLPPASRSHFLQAPARSRAGDKQRELQHQIGDASAQELQALAQLQAIRDEKAAIDARVTELDQQIAAAQSRLADREADARRLTAAYEKVRQRLLGAQSKLDAAQGILDDTAAQMYRSARNGSQYETALAAPPEAMVQSDAYLDTVSAKRRRIVERVERLRDEIESQRRAAEADKADADAAREAAQVERDGIAALRSEIEPARAEAAERQAAEEQALASIQARKAEFEGELALAPGGIGVGHGAPGRRLAGYGRHTM